MYTITTIKLNHYGGARDFRGNEHPGGGRLVPTKILIVLHGQILTIGQLRFSAFWPVARGRCWGQTSSIASPLHAHFVPGSRLAGAPHVWVVNCWPGRNQSSLSPRASNSITSSKNTHSSLERLWEPFPRYNTIILMPWLWRWKSRRCSETQFSRDKVHRESTDRKTGIRFWA